MIMRFRTMPTKMRKNNYNSKSKLVVLSPSAQLCVYHINTNLFDVYDNVRVSYRDDGYTRFGVEAYASASFVDYPQWKSLKVKVSENARELNWNGSVRNGFISYWVDDELTENDFKTIREYAVDIVNDKIARRMEKIDELNEEIDFLKSLLLSSEEN